MTNDPTPEPAEEDSLLHAPAHTGDVTQRYASRPRCVWCDGPLWRDADIEPSSRALHTGVCDDCELDYYDIQTRAVARPPWVTNGPIATPTAPPGPRIAVTCQAFFRELWAAWRTTAIAKKGGLPTEPEIAEVMDLQYETFRTRRTNCGYKAWKPLARKLNDSSTVYDLYDRDQG